LETFHYATLGNVSCQGQTNTESADVSIFYSCDIQVVNEQAVLALKIRIGYWSLCATPLPKKSREHKWTNPKPDLKLF